MIFPTIKTPDGKMTIIVNTPLDSRESCALFAESLDSLMEAGVKEIVLDLDLVSAIDTSGVGKILMYYKRLVMIGGFLYLKTPLKGQVEKVLCELGIAELLKEYGGNNESNISSR